jgi:hypothetical protein
MHNTMGLILSTTKRKKKTDKFPGRHTVPKLTQDKVAWAGGVAQAVRMPALQA